jgi:hypothetical protein
VPRNVVEATARSTAPRTVVWDLLADVPRWSDWGRLANHPSSSAEASRERLRATARLRMP